MPSQPLPIPDRRGCGVFGGTPALSMRRFLFAFPVSAALFVLPEWA